jgi:hypothetical protein
MANPLEKAVSEHEFRTTTKLHPDKNDEVKRLLAKSINVDPCEIAIKTMDKKRLVILVHGIRTRAEWQSRRWCNVLSVLSMFDPAA